MMAPTHTMPATSTTKEPTTTPSRTRPTKTRHTTRRRTTQTGDTPVLVQERNNARAIQAPPCMMQTHPSRHRPSRRPHWTPTGCPRPESKLRTSRSRAVGVQLSTTSPWHTALASKEGHLTSSRDYDGATPSSGLAPSATHVGPSRSSSRLHTRTSNGTSST